MSITQRDLHTQLGAEMRANHGRVAALARPLDPERLVRRPGPHAWSVGDTLEHLLLMDELFLGAAQTAMRGARPDAAAPLREWRPSFIGRMVVGSLERPKPLKSPKAGRPGTPRAGVVERFLTHDARYLAAMDDAASLDWRAVRFAPPLAPWLPLRFNLGDAFRLHAVHVRRHLGQMERVVAATA
jgi:hypothetical protein